MIYIITEEDYSDDSDDKVKQIKFVLSHDFRVPADCLETWERSTFGSGPATHFHMDFWLWNLWNG